MLISIIVCFVNWSSVSQIVEECCIVKFSCVLQMVFYVYETFVESTEKRKCLL